MALNFIQSLLPLLLVFAFINSVASDPDITSDFITPANFSSVNGTFFTFTGFRDLPGPIQGTLMVTKASLVEFPALDGQSVSMAVLKFPPAGINPPHTHPRATELLFTVSGTLEVAFIDTKNVLYTKQIEAGDMFVFPKGLVHYQYNRNHKNPAIAISAFGSANAGTVSVPNSVFGTAIDDEILAKSFKTDIATIQKIKSGFASP
ncbi:unnamed protein product [Fraxinus pennsylvanica]|uniref:Germin-like protein n=1 Tax=Fraxinus pennsylvanica TaxID=56036 RepID=A0AAD1ZNQ9_9LAMI|nr:unnamed protein product [Fraxinus pennsylvanica]